MASVMEPIQLDEGTEGDQTCSTNYRFLQIGQPVPIQPPSAADSLYDSQNPPSLPLAVSERFRLLFVAHSDGFYVAKTKEVMAAAEDFKDKGSGPSIHDLSTTNISIGRVSILALSSHDSWLAASVANQFHLFSMSALLHKEVEPSFSVSLDDSSCVKDVKWAKEVEKDFVVLSSSGKLYHGFGLGSLENVLVNVDAVEWSANGDFVAVARKNILSIMTSKFEEKLSFSLSPNSLIVDSVRWVRADRMIIGCFELDDDSEQTTYVVQVVTTHEKDVTCISSKPAVVSFCDMFLDYRCDVVPGASGPNMFLYYLENHELAFIANRRNLSQHVVLLGWLPEDKNSGAAMIEVSNDAWCAHIESQGNGDDNLILALSVDKVSHNEGLKFILGEKETEVSPCCVLLCVTVDGRISLFHFASAAGSSLDSAENRPSVIPSDVTKQNVPHVSLTLQHDEPSGVVPGNTHGNNVASGKNTSSPSINDNKAKAQSSFGNQDPISPVTLPTIKDDNGETFASTKPKQDRDTQPSEFAEKPIFESENSPFRTSHPKVPGTRVMDLYKTETPAIAEAKPRADSLSDKVSTNFFSQSVSKSIQTSSSSEFQGKNIPTDSRIAAPSSSFGKKVPLRTSDDRSSSAGVVYQSAPDLKETSNPSVRLSFSGQKVTSMVDDRSLSPASCDSQVLSQKSFMSGKSSMPRLNDENSTSTSHPQHSNHEQKLSIQFSNVEVLVKKMDRLLECIGAEGGLKDASITSQEGSVAALEEGLLIMSERCRMWRGTLEERLREVQLLLDKTVQVLARKVHIEGIFQQATDNWYSDLWNSQKLSSELELKRQHILKVDQELASQLVQLERHFNTIELNKFGESGIFQENQKGNQSGYGKPRKQSLRSLQNTMSAQLAAAEKLSECLWNQMTSLRIECQDSKQNVKREVFEMLGLAYDGASYNSSLKGKASDSPTKVLPVNSSSVTAKELYSKDLFTPVKDSEPQTVRRHRESLDQMRSTSVPLKTTVKRILLQEDCRNCESRLPTEVKDLPLKLQLPEKSALVHSGLSDGSAKSVFQCKSKINSKTPIKKSTECSPMPLYDWTDGFAESGTSFSGKLVSDSSSGKISGGDYRYVKQSEIFLSDSPSISERSPVFSTSFKKSSEIPNFGNEEVWPSRSASRAVKPALTSDISFPDSNISHKAPLSLGLISSSSRFLGKAWDAEISAGENNLGEKMTPFPVMQSNLNASDQVGLSSASTSFSKLSAEIKPHATSLGQFSSGSHAKLDTYQNISQSHSLFSSSWMSPTTSSFLVEDKGSLSSTTPTLIKESSESLESGSQPLLAMFGSNENKSLTTPTVISNSSLTRGEISKVEAPLSQPGLPTGSSGLSIVHEIQSIPASKLPAGKSENQLNIEGVSSLVSEMEPNSMLGQPWLSRNNSPAAVFSGASAVGKDMSSVNNEDEMEEEAPEGSLTTELILGDLGVFGFGSTSTSTVTKPTPFGLEMFNKTAAPVSSPLAMTAPGELFRPASFDFQPQLPSQSSIGATSSLFPSSFNTGSASLGSPSSGFGQPAQFGSGQQALGSVLGSFGQSRQLGAGQHGNSIATPSGGFGGGFASLATGADTGGFAAGGFAAAATSGGGFAAAAAPSGGVGFGAFGNQVGGSFSAYTSSSGAGRPPSDLFTQMRK